jgi:hypothetical protein
MLIVRWRSGAAGRRENPPLSEVARELNGRAIGDVEDKASGQVIKGGQQLSNRPQGFDSAWAFIGTSRSR